MFMRLTLPLLLCLLSTACVTQSATMGSVSKDLVTECVAHCASLDMKLTAMVVIRSSAGCVCEPKDSQARPVASAAVVAGGAAMADDEAQQQNTAQQQAQQSAGH
jgi:hypothetical protein